MERVARHEIGAAAPAALVTSNIYAIDIMSP
jgi:hypothetical protein